MEKRNLSEEFRGESYPTVTGTLIPKDAISLEALAAWAESVERRLIGTEEKDDANRFLADVNRSLKEGVTHDGRGHYRLNGRLIRKEEAYL